MKSAVDKVMWMGRATVFSVGLAVTLALMLGVATVALAAVPGDPFKLGKVNTINALSTVAGSVNGALLRIDNDSGLSDATALNLSVQSGKPPLKVNSNVKVANLNADLLDGRDQSAFLQRNSVQVDGAVSDGTMNDFTSKSYTSVLSKSVNAPEAGFLHISGSISAEEDCSLDGIRPGSISYQLKVDGTPVTDGSPGYELGYPDCNFAPANAGDIGDSGTVTVVVPVDQGSHTINLEALENGAGSVIQGRSITTIFAQKGSANSLSAGVTSGTPSANGNQQEQQ